MILFGRYAPIRCIGTPSCAKRKRSRPRGRALPCIDGAETTHPTKELPPSQHGRADVARMGTQRVLVDASGGPHVALTHRPGVRITTHRGGAPGLGPGAPGERRAPRLKNTPGTPVPRCPPAAPPVPGWVARVYAGVRVSGRALGAQRVPAHPPGRGRAPGRERAPACVPRACARRTVTLVPFHGALRCLIP